MRWVLLDRFRSDAAIGDVTCPILMIHGQRDTIVPMALGRKLFDAAPERSSTGIPKRFLELPAADHNDILFVARAPFQAGLRQFFSVLRSDD